MRICCTFFKSKVLKQKNKKNKKQPNDTFNRFHSPVIVHRKHEGAVTRHAFLPSSARKHLQLQGGLPPPTPPAYRFFFSGYASECLSLYDIFEMSTVVLLIFEACITHLIHVKLITFDILVYTCIAYGNVKHKKLFHRITNNK